MRAECPIQLPAGDVLFKDHFYWTFYGSTVWKCALIVPAVLAIFLLGTNVLSGAPITAGLLLSILYLSFVILVMIFIWTFLLISMQFKRLSSTQRSVTWTFSKVGVAVKDKAGNEIKKPWSEIKAVKYFGLGVRIEFSPFGSFWVPNRWFTENQILELKALTQSFSL